jgi:galactokinase/mevalonate kinase-like predicted kinase
LPLVAVCTGIQHNSGDVHGRMRPRYLAEYCSWENSGGKPPPLVDWMSSAWETAWRGKIALLENDLPTFGRLMNNNHALVDQMMNYCGFTDGAGWANNLLIDIALQNGALGAKLTGAGGGGSVFALTQPGDEERLAQVWQAAAQAQGLTSALIYRPRISRQGLLVSRDND